MTWSSTATRNTARHEQAVYDRRVTELDLKRNFERADHQETSGLSWYPDVMLSAAAVEPIPLSTDADGVITLPQGARVGLFPSSARR